jgi:hypothetical protein
MCITEFILITPQHMQTFSLKRQLSVQYHCIFRRCPLSGFLKNREHIISETGFVSFFRLERDLLCKVSSERPDLNN